jgi:hypothetical protein
LGRKKARLLYRSAKPNGVVGQGNRSRFSVISVGVGPGALGVTGAIMRTVACNDLKGVSWLGLIALYHFQIRRYSSTISSSKHGYFHKVMEILFSGGF